MLEDLGQPKPRYSCKVASIKETLNETDAEILENAINNPAWHLSALEKALRNKGLQISDKPIKAHRDKVCSCY